MKNICVVTSTRADYGILKPLIKRIADSTDMRLKLVVTGMHLCMDMGMTYKEIEADGFTINEKIEVMLASDTDVGMTKSSGLVLLSFADYFLKNKPDLLVVLGDRFEIAAVCCAAVNARIPIAHLHGGETTEGAIDECYRHMITKMSWLHFTSCEKYRKRVVQLGENPSRVFNVGALGVENVLHTRLISLNKLSLLLEFSLEEEKYCVVTFHPVTMENETGAIQLNELMKAIDRLGKYKFIITKSNADAGGREINKMWEEYAASRENCVVVASLGMKRYLSALKYAKAMIGNSSSGLIEGPALKIPTVDIGDRQKGRIASESVIHCEPNSGSITNAIQKAFSDDFQNLVSTISNPFGDGDTSLKILSIIREKLDKDTDYKKQFYDIEFEV